MLPVVFKKSLSYNIFERFLMFLIVFLLFMVLFSAALPIAQIFILHGLAPVPNFILKPLIILAFLTLILLSKSIYFKSNCIYLFFIITFVYLGLDIVFLGLPSEVNFIDTINSFNSYYFYFIVAFLALILRPNRLLNRYIRFIGAFLFFICIIFALQQFITGSNILPMQSTDGNFKILSYDFYGKNRFFGLAGSPLDMGIISTCFASLGLWGILQERKIVWFLLFIASVYIVYITYTRVAYIQLAVSLFFILIYNFKSFRYSFIPYLYPIFVAVISYFLVIRNLSNSAQQWGSLLANGTLTQRYGNWIDMLSKWHTAGDYQYLFGLGISQNLETLIDNTYIALLVHIGLVGTVILIFFMYAMWIYMLKNVSVKSDFLKVAFIASWSSIFSAANFNIIFVNYAIIFCLFALLNEEKNTKEENSFNSRRIK